jgi:hypothetical protein
VHTSLADLGERAEREGAAAAEPPHEVALGLERHPAVGVLKRGHCRPRRIVVGPRLDTEASLAGRGDHLGHRHRGYVLWHDAQAQQPGRGEHERVHVALGELAQPSVHVAPQVFQQDVGAPPEDLRPPAQARGADHSARGQGALPSDEDVERARPLRDHRERDPTLVLGGQVLRRMHSEVDLSLAQRADDLLDPQPLQSRGRSLSRRPPVTRGHDRHELGSHAERLELLGDTTALSHRERRTPGADPQRHDGSLFMSGRVPSSAPRPTRAGRRRSGPRRG